MHVFCEKCIEMALFVVTLLPFLTENCPSRSLRLHTIQWYINMILTELKLVVAVLKCYSETKGSAKYISKI